MLNLTYMLSNLTKKFSFLKEIHFYLLINLIIYLLFFYKLLDTRYTLWSSDARYGTFPPQVYLAEKLAKFEYPFWTERAYLGFAPYQDSEIGYLNPLNLLFTFIFGYRSLNFVHVFSYFIGIYCFYKIFEKLKYNFWSKILAILPFYYSFFHLNHLSHTMIIFTSLLLPVQIYLLTLFIDSKRLRYLVLQGIVIAVGLTWGHPQVTLVNLFGLFIFGYYNFKNIKELFKYFVFAGIFTLSFSMIQIYPTITVYFQSERFVNELKYLNVTNFPLLNLALVFPYLFGYFGNYQGIEISGGLSFVETYNYIGIVTSVLLITYLLFGSKDKNFKMIYSGIMFFVIISSLKSFPILENIQIPFIDSLRYWTRSIYLVLFFASFGIGYLLNNKISFKDLKFKYIGLILGYYLLSNLLSHNELISKTYVFLLSRNFDYLKKIDILIWVLLFFISIIFILLRNRFQKTWLLIILTGFMLFDFRYFSMDFTHFRITRFAKPESIRIPEVCLSNRCLLENTNLSSYEGIATKAYTPYGYSQFMSLDYLDYYKNNIGGDPRFAPRSETLRSVININELKRVGFKAVVLANNNNIYLIDSPKLDLFSKNLSGEYLKRKEGDLKLIVQIPESGYYETTLRYSPFWKLKINSTESSLEKDGLFTKMYLEKGENKIDIYYFPQDLVYGVIFGFGFFLIGLLIYAFTNKNSLWIIVSNKIFKIKA